MLGSLCRGSLRSPLCPSVKSLSCVVHCSCIHAMVYILIQGYHLFPFVCVLYVANAKHALDLAKMQEQTLQFKHQEEIRVSIP